MAIPAAAHVAAAAMLEIRRVTHHVGDHQIEDAAVWSAAIKGAASGHRGPAMTLKPDAHGLPATQIVIHHQNMAHSGLLPLVPANSRLRIDCVGLFNRESVHESYFRRKRCGLSALQRV